MSRSKIALFKASCKDPDLQKTIKNAIDYRRRKQVPEDRILADLLATYGTSPHILLPRELLLCDTDAMPGELFEGGASGQDDELNLEAEKASCQSAELNSAASGQDDELKAEISPASGQTDGLNHAFSPASGQSDELNLEAGKASGQDDELNLKGETAPDGCGILEVYGPIWHPVSPEPTDEQVAAVIAEIEQLKSNRIRNVAEGVVIETPFARARMHKKPPAEPVETSEPETEKTAETDPMRKEPQPSLTRTLFSTLALLALISYISYYLISATQTLYGTVAAVILVVIPLAVVFFVRVPVLRYIALAVFLAADLWSLRAIYQKDMAIVQETTLSLNPEYQRLKGEHAQLTIERDAINPGTHPTTRRRITSDMKKVSERMAVIESESKTDLRAEADTTKAEVTLGIRALFLLAAALLAHPLLHYSTVLNYDAFMKKAFGRDEKL